MKRYFQLQQNGSVADLDIYGDITSFPIIKGDTSAANLSHQLEELVGVSQINVHINSYGGEVAEGLAIYNALRRNPARIVTTCDGMACSIASVIFMAGDERIMSESSLLMIHNAFVFAAGDAAELRKAADDVETINQASKSAYLSRVSISEQELTQMMDAETFILPEDALSMGFATAVEVFERADAVAQAAAQSARGLIVERLTGNVQPSQFLKRGVKPPDIEEVDSTDDPENPDDPDDKDEEAKQADSPDRRDDDPDDRPDRREDDPDDPDDPDDDPDGPDDPDDPDNPTRRPKAALQLATFLKMEEK